MAERFNQETDERYNREPGVLINPMSPHSKEMAKFEQFPSQYGSPGNPYVYRPFPKMVLRARLHQGVPRCMAAPLDPYAFTNAAEMARAQEAAEQFNRECQLVVNNEKELQAAFENGYRHTVEEAVEYLRNRQLGESRAQAERRHQERGLSENAKAEAKAEETRIFHDEGRIAGEIPEKPRRGRPRKNAAA